MGPNILDASILLEIANKILLESNKSAHIRIRKKLLELIEELDRTIEGD